ncbi:MAG: beta-ketoacyl synthase N-terminal-like domain-containing protein [Pseudomonas sp.]|uniref:beta-ketoacyl synthase N-terminal-like domain-containing protein n=1 Tax=Pseudomonas sp. TaxID=306 RepID=UPI00339314B7
MARFSNPIAIAGMGCVLPSGLGAERFWQAARDGRSGIVPLRSADFHSRRISAFGHVTQEDHQRCREDVAQNLQRYGALSMIWGVSAVRQALQEAGVDPSRDRLTFGLYCCQGGYTHPSLESYADLLRDCTAAQGGLDSRKLAKRVLQDHALEPFLVLKSLSNCLLGIVSLAYKLESECNAYMQGVAGNQAALREACAALLSYRVDVAIVVGAGSELDAMALSALVQAGVISATGADSFRPFDQAGTGGIAGEGAAALILRRSEDQPGARQTQLVGLSAHAELSGLELPAYPVDLLVCSGSAIPERDRQLCETLAQAKPKAITNIQPVTGLLSAAPSLVDLILARSALQAQCVPPIIGLSQPVAEGLPFATGTSRPARLHRCAVLNRDDNGFSACYQLEYRDDPRDS